MDMMAETKKIIFEFLEENYLVDFSEVKTNTNLFKEGYIDSFGYVELIQFLENQFSLEIPNEALVSGEFTSLDKIVTFIEKKSREKM
jgi:acyl carrier protein